MKSKQERWGYFTEQDEKAVTKDDCFDLPPEGSKALKALRREWQTLDKYLKPDHRFRKTPDDE